MTLLLFFLFFISPSFETQKQNAGKVVNICMLENAIFFIARKENRLEQCC